MPEMRFKVMRVENKATVPTTVRELEIETEVREWLRKAQGLTS